MYYHSKKPKTSLKILIKSLALIKITVKPPSILLIPTGFLKFHHYETPKIQALFAL
jgi:hypothetical protein